MTYVPLVTSIIAFIFGVAVLDQYFARRRPFQLLWAIGLFMYCVSAFTEFRWNIAGHNELLYRLWYLIGGILVAAYLGQGTMYLLLKRRTANIIMAILGAASLYAVVRTFMVDIDISGLTKLAGGVMPGDLRAAAGILNAYGTFALVGGALWSAWVFWRKRILGHRVLSNILIALGAILPAIGGTHLTVGGTNIDLFYLFELAGVIIMFLGFLRTKEVFGLYRLPLVHGFKKIAESGAG